MSKETEGISVEEKPIEEYVKLHMYSRGRPNGLGTLDLLEWLHLSKDVADRKNGHAELIGDLRYLSSSDFDISEYPDLLKLNADHFHEIHLDYCLEYIEWKNQEEFLTYIWNILKPFGRLIVSCRNLTRVFPSGKGKILPFLTDSKQWEKLMQTIYSSGAPGDWFMACHSRASIKKCLIAAGFGNIIFKSKKGEEIKVIAVKREDD